MKKKIIKNYNMKDRKKNKLINYNNIIQIKMIQIKIMYIKKN